MLAFAVKLQQSAVGAQQIDELLQPLPRFGGGDAGVVIVGQDAAGAAEDLLVQLPAAHLLQRLPNGRDDEALVAGKQQHQRGRRWRRSASAGGRGRRGAPSYTRPGPPTPGR